MTPRGTTSAPTACASSVTLVAGVVFGFSIEVGYANAMHTLLIAASLFAQVSISREAAVDPATADKTYTAMSASLDDEVRHKLDRAHVTIDLKTAREAVAKALPGARLSPETTDALAF